MNLHSVSQLFAGGPGSGCRGNNCGRPSTGSKSIPKRLVRQSWTAPVGGAKVTLLQTPKRGRPSGAAKGSPKALLKKASSMKGKFSQVISTKQYGSKQPSAVYSTYPKNGQPGDTNFKEGAGKTLFVFRDFGTGRATVQEFTHGEYGHIGKATMFGFKNLGRAAGFLSQRYGITQKFKGAK
jgi:hypothetical protein